MNTTTKPRTEDIVRAAFERGERHDMLSAYHSLGTTRLSEYVRRLRAQGVPIRTEMRETRNGKKYATYYLPK